MKNRYVYLIVLIIGISLSIYFYALKNDVKSTSILVTNNNLLNESQEEIGTVDSETYISEIIEVDFPEPLNRIYKVGDKNNYLYTLSYNPSGDELELNDTIKKKESTPVSDIINLILREVYPNVSLAEMGVNSKEEAYQVTQLAIWEIAMRTGESEYSSEMTYIDSIKYELGINSKTYNVIRKAKDLVMRIEDYAWNEETNDDINMITTAIVNTESVRYKFLDDGIVVGPYKYRVENGNIEDTDIVFENIKGNAAEYVSIVDENNNIIKEFDLDDEIYIKIPEEKKFEDFELTVKFKCKVKKIVGEIFENEKSDYLVNTTYHFPEWLEQDIKINYEDMKSIYEDLKRDIENNTNK